MKIIYSLLAIILLCTDCKKGDTGPAGPAGPAGPQGPQGPVGVAGNANVTQYTYGAQNFPTIGFASLQVTTTLDTMNRSAWFVYCFYQPLERWYFMPGHGPGGSTQYRISMGYASNKVTIFVDKVGTGDNFAQAKVVRVYASNTATGGIRAPAPGIDFTDYQQVKAFYKLP